MKTVVVFEKQTNGKLFVLTKKCLSAFGSVFSVNENEITGKCTPDFLLTGTKNAKQIVSESGILIFEHGFKADPHGCKAEGLIPIISFEDRRAAYFLKNIALPTVTIGASGKATLSIASFSRERSVISLQRSIYTLSGALIEPYDFSVENTGHLSLEEILLFSAVLLISDIPTDYDFSFFE